MARGLPYLLVVASSSLYDESRLQRASQSMVPDKGAISKMHLALYATRVALAGCLVQYRVPGCDRLLGSAYSRGKRKDEPWRGSDPKPGHGIDKDIRSFSAKMLAVRFRERREFPSSSPSRTRRCPCPAEPCNMRISGRQVAISSAVNGCRVLEGPR